MRRMSIGLSAILIVAAAATLPARPGPAQASRLAVAGLKCRSVVKKVHGHKKRVRVCSRPKPTPTPTTSQFPYALSPVTRVAQLIGSTPDGPNASLDPDPHSINDSTLWGVCGGDLGSLMVAGGTGYIALGDNFSQCPDGPPGNGPNIWRSNAVGIISNPADFANGLHIDRWVTNDGKRAAEVIPSQHDAGQCQDTETPDCEVTTIPTYSFPVQGNLFLAFMSVHHWGSPGLWDVNYSSFAMSADQGKSWQVETDRIKWGPDSNFAQVAVAPDPSGQYLLFYGIPAGRLGEVKLMRAPSTVDGVLDSGAYQYFTGIDASGQPQWSSDQSKAAVDIHGYVGELSVIYDPGLHQWLQTDLEGNSYLVIRSAPNYWGPWSEPATMATQGDFPELYGAFMEPHFLADNGHTVYFVMSQFGPYRIYWMKVMLNEKK